MSYQSTRSPEEMERFWGERVSEHAAEAAYRYSRSAVFPGEGRGAALAITAADRAEATYAHDEVVAFLRVALDLAPNDDPRRPRLLARLGLALTWTLKPEEDSPPTRRQRHRPNQSAELGARRTDERVSQKLAFRSSVRVHKVG
jgi:hypothetical protein